MSHRERLTELETQLGDLLIEQKEVEECGDLEDRFDLLNEILNIKREIERIRSEQAYKVNEPLCKKRWA